MTITKCFSQFTSACKNWNEIDYFDWLFTEKAMKTP